jgi:hypothetical protein
MVHKRIVYAPCINNTQNHFTAKMVFDYNPLKPFHSKNGFGIKNAAEIQIGNQIENDAETIDFAIGTTETRFHFDFDSSLSDFVFVSPNYRVYDFNLRWV